MIMIIMIDEWWWRFLLIYVYLSNVMIWKFIKSNQLLLSIDHVLKFKWLNLKIKQNKRNYFIIDIVPMFAKNVCRCWSRLIALLHCAENHHQHHHQIPSSLAITNKQKKLNLQLSLMLTNDDRYRHHNHLEFLF